MIYKIRYAPQAIEDLKQLREDIFEVSKSLDTTGKYLTELFDAVEKKRLFPQSGIRLMYNDLFTGFYFVHFKAYNAFYRVMEDRIEVVRILSSKSDYMRTLFPDYYVDEIELSEEVDHVNESESK